MATEIWRDFDPNLDIPIGLKNARPIHIEGWKELIELGLVLDEQEDTESDDDSQLPEDEVDDELDVPVLLKIVKQTIRTAKDGRQVSDVVIKVSDVKGATNYEVRITKK